MALIIVRNDITKMNVDAIVNTTNEHFEVGGLGVDAGIHHAAGPQLKEALARIGYCPTGSAVITDAFDIPGCRYIIHTVGPIYVDGRYNEKKQLESCYRSVLALAWEKGCHSLAIPLISAGAYGYPKAEAYSIATSCIREFLLSLPDDEDMMIYIVLFDGEAVAVSEKVDSGVEQFITEAYLSQKKEELSTLYEQRRPQDEEKRESHLFSFNRLRRRVPRDERRRLEEAYRKDEFPIEAPSAPGPSADTAVFDAEELTPEPAAPVPSSAPKPYPTTASYAAPLYDAAPLFSAAPAPGTVAGPAHCPGEGYEKEDRAFAEMCEWWCREKGISKKEFYVHSNINKSMFWGIKNHPGQIPKKTSAIACAIGLKLDYDQAIDLLKRAGLTLSRYYELDVIIEYFIRHKNYDIYEINEVLYDKDLPQLGQKTD